MVVHLACQCGNDITVPDSASGTVIRCPRCGRSLDASDGAPTLEFHERTPPEEETNFLSGKPVADEIDDAVTQITMTRPVPVDETSAPPEDDDGATRIFDSKTGARNDEQDFELVDPDDDETKLSSDPNLPSGSSHGSRSGSSSRISELDLKERVMGTISRSSVPQSALLDSSGTDSGGYGFHRILRTHQKGGMGRILIAYDQFLKRDIALKELHPEVAEDMSIVRRFIGEAEITAQLEHPGIVPIHILGQDRNGFPYYTMKLIKGHTLQEAIKAYHRNPSKPELMHLIRRLVSICKTIAFSHNKGVIHRDLKPANIMLGEHGETLVMDWGLAKPIEQLRSEESAYASVAVDHRSSEPRPELTMVGAIVGTPAFMSPEQASPEENKVGPLSDIFSLGTILYYLLAGQTAFSGRSTQEVLNKVRAASPPKPSEIKSNVPPGLEAICAKAMARNPEDRYQTAKEMDEDLCRWLDGEPIRAQKETFVQKIRRWVDHHRLLAVSIPFLLVLFVVLMNIVIYIDRFGRERHREESVYAVLNNAVDLTDQASVTFRGSPGVSVEREPRLTGGEMIVCRIEAIPDSKHGVVEIIAPARFTWDLTHRGRLQISLFEPHSTKEDLPLSTFFIRLGRGSSYFEYRPDSDWWAKRRIGNWFTFTVPLEGSSVWIKTESGAPSLARVEWIEFHFNVKTTEMFQIDNVTFLSNEIGTSTVSGPRPSDPD